MTKLFGLFKVSVLFFVLAAGVAAAETIDVSKLPKGPRGPIFKNRVLPKPDGVARVTAADFAIKPERVAKIGDTLYGKAELVKQLADYLQNTEHGRRLWSSCVNEAVLAVNDWSFGTPKRVDRYVYNISSYGQRGLVYLFTGNESYGKLLKAYLFDALDLPMEFWVHAELRGYNSAKPLGQLESGHLARALSQFMSACGDEIFTPEEKARIDAVLRQKNLIPLRNWLDANSKTVTNFVGNVSSSYFMMAAYLGENQARSFAFQRLLRYINDGVENDGSYGEGGGYFIYAFGMATTAWRSFSDSERAEFIRRVNFRKSSRWLASRYFMLTNGRGKPIPYHVGFCDSGYCTTPDKLMMNYLMTWYGDPLVAWLVKHFGVEDSETRSLLAQLELIGVNSNEKIAPKSPSELNLPLLAVVDNGEVNMRTSWEPDSLFVSMKRSLFTRTGTTHNHPESNNVVLGAKGEYFVVAPSCSSYRSPICKKYDRSTVSANVVTLGNRNQRKASPGSQARLLTTKSTSAYLLTAQDSAPVIPETSRAVRVVVLLKKSGVAVIFDRIESSSGAKKHRFKSRWHFYNRDDASKLDAAGGGAYLLKRPLADLAIFSGADVPLEYSITPTYMHGTKRDYNPGGPNEGKLGSSLELASTTPSVNDATFVAVFQPLAKNSKALPVSYKDGEVSIGTHRLRLRGGALTIDGVTTRIF